MAMIATLFQKRNEKYLIYWAFLSLKFYLQVKEVVTSFLRDCYWDYLHSMVTTLQWAVIGIHWSSYYLAICTNLFLVPPKSFFSSFVSFSNFSMIYHITFWFSFSLIFPPLSSFLHHTFQHTAKRIHLWPKSKTLSKWFFELINIWHSKMLGRHWFSEISGHTPRI